MSRKDPEWNKKNKKSDANVNRIFGIVEKSQSLGKGWRTNILPWGLCKSCFPHEHWENASFFFF